MPHEVDGQPHWHEPGGDDFAGLRQYPRPASPYDRYLTDEGIPVWRGVGFESLDVVPLAPWPRTGGRGSHIQLHGTEGRLGCHLVEIPAAGALAPERHLYEEVMLVVSGRGSTELWLGSGTERHLFEWQAGAMFAIPRNCHHRLVNATASPAGLMSFNTAPALIDLLGSAEAVFDSPQRFADRLDTAELQPWDDVEPDPVDGLACTRTAHLPDSIACDLPLDNRESPGYRRLALDMTGGMLRLALGQHRIGRYGRALFGEDGVALTLAGRGETWLWQGAAMPATGGQAIATVPFGMVALAPSGPGFSQHFNRAAVPFRQLFVTLARPGIPGATVVDRTTLPLADGGTMVPYWAEDPEIRRLHAEALAVASVDNRMHAAFYAP